ADAEPVHALAGADAQVQLGHRLVEHGLFLLAQVVGAGEAALELAALFQRLAEPQTSARQDFLDLAKRGLAEILAAQELLLADARQIAKRADVHLLEAIAAADGQLEIGYRNLQHLA